MRHKVYGKHLGRNKNQRTALFKSLLSSLILSEKIQTTESKAKAVKPLIDKIITQAKSKTAQKLVFEFFPQKSVAQKLVDDILPRTGSRTSGYTSTIRTGARQGDGAMMVSMSLILEEPKTSKSVKETKVSAKELSNKNQESSSENLESSAKTVKSKKQTEEKKGKKA